MDRGQCCSAPLYFRGPTNNSGLQCSSRHGHIQLMLEVPIRSSLAHQRLVAPRKLPVVELESNYCGAHNHSDECGLLHVIGSRTVLSPHTIVILAGGDPKRLHTDFLDLRRGGCRVVRSERDNRLRSATDNFAVCEERHASRNYHSAGRPTAFSSR